MATDSKSTATTPEIPEGFTSKKETVSVGKGTGAVKYDLQILNGPLAAWTRQAALVATRRSTADAPVTGDEVLAEWLNQLQDERASQLGKNAVRLATAKKVEVDADGAPKDESVQARTTAIAEAVEKHQTAAATYLIGASKRGGKRSTDGITQKVKNAIGADIMALVTSGRMPTQKDMAEICAKHGVDPKAYSAAK